MEKAVTSASSLEVEQDSGSGPRCQDTILRGAKAQTRFEAASKQSNDPPLSRVNTLAKVEGGRMKTKELVLALEITKSNQALEIESLKRRVKCLEKRRKSRTPRRRCIQIWRKIADLAHNDAEVTLVDDSRDE
ncbi:hypothetical protein Tco_0204484 [Tanacetum coccineum]